MILTREEFQTMWEAVKSKSAQSMLRKAMIVTVEDFASRIKSTRRANLAKKLKK